MNQLIDKEKRPVVLDSLKAWEEIKVKALDAVQQVMGPLPGAAKPCALAVEIEEEVDCGSYTRQLLSYAAKPGGQVPAYLLIVPAL
jgi:hypothetical protein